MLHYLNMLIHSHTNQLYTLFEANVVSFFFLINVIQCNHARPVVLLYNIPCLFSDINKYVYMLRYIYLTVVGLLISKGVAKYGRFFTFVLVVVYCIRCRDLQYSENLLTCRMQTDRTSVQLSCSMIKPVPWLITGEASEIWRTIWHQVPCCFDVSMMDIRIIMPWIGVYHGEMDVIQWTW